MVHGFGACPSKAKAVIVGEAPGNQEARLGLPFVGPSGNLIRSLLKHAGFKTPTSKEALTLHELEQAQGAMDGVDDMGEIYYTNAIPCFPGRSEAATYKTSELKKLAAVCCKGHLMAELEPYREAGVPICAVGGSSSLVLAGSAAITKMRSKWYRNNTVLCTWHPAYILRQPSRVGELAMDMRKLFSGKPAYLDFPEVKVIYIDTVKKMRHLTRFLIQNCQPTEEFDGDSPIPYATVAMDIESENINWLTDKILCIQVSWNVHSGAVITEDIVYEPEVRDCLIELFDPANGIKWVGHNFKFDMRFLRHQLGVHNVHTNYDTLIADYVLDENKNHALKVVLTEMYDLPDYEQDLVLKYLKNKNDNYGKVPRKHLYKYGVLDTAYTLRMWYDLRDRLEKSGLFEQPFMYPIMEAQGAYLDMELHGMLISRPVLEQLSKRLRATLDKTQGRLEKMCERSLNLNSHVQVRKVFYDHYKMPVFKATTKTGLSVDAKRRGLIESRYIEQGYTPENHEPYKWLYMFGLWKKMEKIRNSYVDNVNKFMDAEGRVHPDILIYGTETGRPSVRNPAVQTIPRTGTGEAFGEVWGKAIKRCYVAPFGYKLVQVDYSQAEMRTATYLSGDPFLTKAYREDIDVHGTVAELWWPGWKEMKDGETRDLPIIGIMDRKTMRVQAKKGVFARLYLGTEHAIAGILGIPPRRAKPYLAKIDTLLGGLVEWEHHQFSLMQKRGYVETLTGRRRRCPLITRDNRDEARKAACNAPVQGMASDLVLMALIIVKKWLDGMRNPALCECDWEMENQLDDVHILMTVHDSILLEVPDHLVPYVGITVKLIMEHVGYEWMPNVPWKADIEVGQSWGELKEQPYSTVQEWEEVWKS
jgi:DNA polymerase I-like protein with 3'-5' exonuclease and polymerase domains/uracil-DNA glycosylase